MFCFFKKLLPVLKGIVASFVFYSTILNSNSGIPPNCFISYSENPTPETRSFGFGPGGVGGFDPLVCLKNEFVSLYSKTELPSNAVPAAPLLNSIRKGIDALNREIFNPDGFSIRNDLLPEASFANLRYNTDSAFSYYLATHIAPYPLATFEMIIEKRKNDLFKDMNNENQEKLKKLEEDIKKVRELQKSNFWKQFNDILSTDGKLNFDTKKTWSVICNLLAYQKCASLEEIQGARRGESKIGSLENDLYKMQQSFLNLCRKFFKSNSNDLDKFVSKLVRENWVSIGQVLRSILYNATWKEDDQLNLFKNVEELKKSIIRSGYCIVKDGVADSNWIIPTAIFARLYYNYFCYDSTGSYSESDSIGNVNLSISKDLVNKMKKADRDYFLGELGYDYFKGNFSFIRYFIYRALFYYMNTFGKLIESLINLHLISAGVNFLKVSLVSIFAPIIWLFSPIILADCYSICSSFQSLRR